MPRTILLLLLLIVTALISCDRTPRQQSLPVDTTSITGRPDSEVSDATISLFSKGVRTSLIRAEQIRKFDKIDSTMAYQVTADFFDSLGQQSSHLIGDSAVIRETTSRLEVFGHVIVTVGDTSRLETEYLLWNQEKQRIETPAFVRIQRNNDLLTGYGLEAERDLSRLRILKGVSGAIEQTDQLIDSL